MGIPVKLEVFEGPLDLLLHLIDKNKIDIYDIPIVVITDQYLEYIENIHTDDMDTLSEFLVMAATLIRIKSKMLLPPEEEEEPEEYEDPRQELVARLIEYKMYKYASFELKDRHMEASRVLYKEQNMPEEVMNWEEDIDTDALLDGITMRKLQDIFETVIKRREDKVDPIRSKFGKIEKEEVSVEDRMEYIRNFAKTEGKFSFTRLLEEQRSRSYIIVSFLAVLELMKTGVLLIEQEQPFDDIIITYR
ncbi:MAG: segregation/condensation protein A [Lachnospiraceae bacterium]|nr:segregation/condensation protein A [Lachnospiraceae bacterium]